MDDLMERLSDVFREVFDDEALEISDATVAADVADWDSLNHVKLVVAIEEAFAVQFSNREIAAWENVGDMRRALDAKLSG
jgi:acyl carrier protein